MVKYIMQLQLKVNKGRNRDRDMESYKSYPTPSVHGKCVDFCENFKNMGHIQET